MPLHTLHDVATICVQHRKATRTSLQIMRNAATMILPEESLVSELTDGVQGTDPV